MFSPHSEWIPGHRRKTRRSANDDDDEDGGGDPWLPTAAVVALHSHGVHLTEAEGTAGPRLWKKNGFMGSTHFARMRGNGVCGAVQGIGRPRGKITQRLPMESRQS